MKPPVLMIGNFLSASGGTLCVCEELSHKLSGLKACNETKWHDALEKLTRDPKLCAAIGQAGRRRCTEEYSIRLWLPTLLGILEKIRN
jgi:hypothetical protein